MTALFGILGFVSPWILIAGLGLPVLWMILRATPPAPVRRFFPAVVLLLGLPDRENEADRTPLWLLILRVAAIAAVIVGLAGPVLNPAPVADGTRPLLILRDGGWAGAATWQARQDRISQALTSAALRGRRVAVVSLAGPNADAITFDTAQNWARRIASQTPYPRQPDPDGVSTWLAAQTDIEAFDTLWVSDGLGWDARENITNFVRDKGALTVFEPNQNVVALRPVILDGAEITVTATRASAKGAETYTVRANGTDPAGRKAVLDGYDLTFDAADVDASIVLSMPAELRNRLTHFSIDKVPSTGAVTLLDGRAKRRRIALSGGAATGEALRLLDPLHYLRAALGPSSEIISADLEVALTANPDVIVLADVARLTGLEGDLRSWVENGGVLLRFGGPRLAASATELGDTDLLPVRLRAGGRDLSGAMSWGSAKTLAPFGPDSPFAGLAVPDDIAILSQVLAEPSPDLAERTLASLVDGTPLVTRRNLGEGQVILFHVTADAGWSNLPLTGLFVDMLDRLSIAPRGAAPTEADIFAQSWQPKQFLDGFGVPVPAGDAAGIAGNVLLEQMQSGRATVGTYVADGREIAVNAVGTADTLRRAQWPANIAVETEILTSERAFGGVLIGIAVCLMMIDIFASLWASGRLRHAGGVVALIWGCLIYGDAQADDARILEATNNVVLAYVETGNSSVDTASRAGLYGLGVTLFRRTAVEPIAPISVDPEIDELSVYPFIYWPIVATVPVPSPAAYRKLNAYLRGGGMILFDTRDDGFVGEGGSSPERRHLQRIALGLDIPPLMPVPTDHVLTRSYYLLQEFPGRHSGGTLWVEATRPSRETGANETLRNQNDGVSPVVMGGGDWAAAWAMDDQRRPLYAVGRGFAGERQREIALRFGVNLVMHVFTGNYKTDQVHVPELLERLGE